MSTQRALNDTLGHVTYTAGSRIEYGFISFFSFICILGVDTRETVPIMGGMKSVFFMFYPFHLWDTYTGE